MGNKISKTLLLDQPEDWRVYINLPWRSNRVKELDQLAGLDREALRLGDSQTLKNQLQDVLKPKLNAPKGLLQTQIRALERQLLEQLAQEPGAGPTPPPVPKGPGGRGRNGVVAPVAVAPWRLRVHRARRRMLLVVMAIVRLWLGLRRTRHRVANLGFCLPLVLRENLGTFGELQCMHLVLQQEMDVYQEALFELQSTGQITARTTPVLSSFSTAGSPSSSMSSLTSSMSSQGSPAAKTQSTALATRLSDVGPAVRLAIASRESRLSVASSTKPGDLLDLAAGPLTQDPPRPGELAAGSRPSTSGSMTPMLAAQQRTAKQFNRLALSSSGSISSGPQPPSSPQSKQAGRPAALRRSTGSFNSSSSDPGNVWAPVIAQLENRVVSGVAASEPDIMTGSRGGVADTLLRPRALISGQPAKAAGSNIPSPDLRERITELRSRMSEDGYRVSQRLSVSRGSNFGADWNVSLGQPLPSAEPPAPEALPSVSPTGPRAGQPPKPRQRFARMSIDGAAGPAKLQRSNSALSQRPRPAPVPSGPRSDPAMAAAPPPPAAAPLEGPAGAELATDRVRALGELPAAPKLKELQRLISELENRMRQTMTGLEETANKCNVEWADKRVWGPARVDDQPARPSWMDNSSYGVYKADVQRRLRVGTLAVQLLVNEDELVLPSGEVQDLWTADPWLLVAQCCPEMMPLGERREGMSYGMRALYQLVMGVEAVAGPEGVDKLSVLMHLSDQQLPQVQADMWAHKELFKRLRERLLIIVHPRHHGYRFSKEAGRFVIDTSSPLAPLGSGYSLLQLTWGGEALRMKDDEGRELEEIKEPVLELLLHRGVEWLLSWRAADVGLCTTDGVMDVPMLAYMLHQHVTQRINLCMQVMQTTSMAVSRSHDSVVLSRTPRSLHHVDVPELPTRAAAAASLSGTVYQGGQLVDLRHSELQSLNMDANIQSTMSTAYNLLTVCLQRYMLHVPSLGRLVNSSLAFRPKILLNRGTARIVLEVSDITANARCRSVALHTRDVKNLAAIKSAADVASLIPYLQAQDTSMAAREAAAAAAAALGPGPQLPDKRSRLARHTYAVLLEAAPHGSSLSRGGWLPVAELQLATVITLARPSQDNVVLIHVASGESAVREAQQKMQTLSAAFMDRGVHARCVVAPRGGDASNGTAPPLLEAIECQLQACHATIVVLGSMRLAHGTVTDLAESVTLGCMRRLVMPMVVVVHGALVPPVPKPPAPPPPGGLPAAGAQPKLSGLRLLTLVEPHARPMLHMLCGMMDPLRRADRLLLALISKPRKTLPVALARSLQSLHNSFADIAQAHDMTGAKLLTLPPPFEQALTLAAQEEKAQVLAVQVPRGFASGRDKHTAKAMVTLMRSCRVPMLLFPDAAARGRVVHW